MIHRKQQHKFHENWEVKEGPTIYDLEAESDSVSCNVCVIEISGLQRLCGDTGGVAKQPEPITEMKVIVFQVFAHDVLESGWRVTSKRGQKPVISITSPQFVAACILMDISSGKNCDVVSIDDRDKEKAEMDKSQPSGDSWMAQIVCANKFVCVICGKAFPSYQAVGGHKASHGKDDTTMVSPAKIEKEVKHSKGLTSRDHRCEVGGVSYPSGQALGGHKLKHWTGSSAVACFAGDRSKASEIQASKFPAREVQCMDLASF